MGIEKNRVVEKITKELIENGICPKCFGALIPSGAHCEVCRNCGEQIGPCYD
jgi:ribosomal protein L40E